MAALTAALAGLAGIAASKLLSGKAPKMPTPPTAPAPPDPTLADNERQQAAAIAARRRVQLATALGSGSPGQMPTLLTGPQGLTTAAPTDRKTLLGQ